MTYNEALSFIYSRRKFQKSSGHERIKRLLELLGNPQKKLRFVHVVGTNGKGSVSTALSFILRCAGYTTGLFTSPFVVDFCERVQVGGKYIEKSSVASITSLIKEKVLLMEKEGLYPTVFEVTTALAMVYFYDMNCDIVVLEAGIGGKKDSTSVIDNACLNVITSVSLDHCDVLGDTVTDIAKEKCGIIKHSSPTVSYPFENEGLPFSAQHTEAVPVITDTCQNAESRLYVPDVKKVRLIKSDLTGNELIYDGLHLKTKMCGTFQTANILTAAEAAKALRDNGFFISDENIESGISEFFIPGRLECAGENPLILLDGGHNEGAMLELCKTLENFKKSKTVLLCAFMKDKTYESSFSLLSKAADTVVFTQADELRGESPEILKQKAKIFFKNAHCEKNAEKAFKKALSLCDKDGLTVVCGSFYLASEIRNKLF